MLAFLCINRIVRFHNKHLLDFALKVRFVVIVSFASSTFGDSFITVLEVQLVVFCTQRIFKVSVCLHLQKMYTSHVKNCRFVTPTTLPLISFMQRSLAELFSINFTLSYQFAFIYIRQLAIHLRNAITVKKKVGN